MRSSTVSPAAAGAGADRRRHRRLTTAKAIAMVHDTPLVAVNHLEAHALTPRLTDGIEFPYCLFLASAGIPRSSPSPVSANMCGSAPPSTTRWAKPSTRSRRCWACPIRAGRRSNAPRQRGCRALRLSRADAGTADANFSLSGLKTAVRNEASRITPLEPQDISDLCASFQAAVLESTADRLTVG
jgi:N6-L-threonylcarbamoyladenine synthase